MRSKRKLSPNIKIYGSEYFQCSLNVTNVTNASSTRVKVPGSLQHFAFVAGSLSLCPLAFLYVKQSNKSNLPEGSGDTVLPGNIGRLKEGGGPGPLRDDDGSGKAGLDHTSGS